MATLAYYQSGWKSEQKAICLFFYSETQGGKADLNNEEDIINIILFLIFFTIENVLFMCVRYRRNGEKME